MLAFDHSDFVTPLQLLTQLCNIFIASLQLLTQLCNLSIMPAYYRTKTITTTIATERQATIPMTFVAITTIIESVTEADPIAIIGTLAAISCNTVVAGANRLIF